MSDEYLNNGPDREEQRPGGAVFSARDMQASAAGSSSGGAGCGRGRGFDVEEYAERIYRANIKLGLAEVPRDYFKPAQAPDSETDRRELVEGRREPALMVRMGCGST